MSKEIFLVLSLLFVVVHANKYTERKCTKDENGQEFCEKPEDIDEEPCFYEDPKESLFQWDPVEVGFLLYVCFLSLMISKQFFI